VKYLPLSLGIGSITVLLVTTACSMSAGPTPSKGPWQFSGTVFAMDGQEVGAPVAGAELTMTSGDEVRARTTSDTSGRYAFNRLETGRFSLTISATGFVSLTPSVNLDRDMRADFALKRQ
jgi:hypothetical protein